MPVGHFPHFLPFTMDAVLRFPSLLATAKVQERKGNINKRKIPGRRPDVPGTPGGTNRSLPAGVAGISYIFTMEKQTAPGVAGTPGHSGVFRNFMCPCDDFVFFVRFLVRKVAERKLPES